MSDKGNKQANPDNNKQKKKKTLYIIIAVMVIIALVVAAWYTYQQQEEVASEGSTAEEITQTNTPSATPGDQEETVATMTTSTLPNGDVTSFRRAPDHIKGIPDDVEVDRGLANHKPGDPIPAGPSEGIIPTLTAPTTYRGEDREGPQLTDPKVGPPDVLAQSFVTDSLSLCLRPDNSYNKNIRENYPHLVTKRLLDRGLSWGDEDHSTDWKAYQDSRNCSKLTSFAQYNSRSIAGEDTIFYNITVNQRVSMTSARGGQMDTDVPPFRGHVIMKFVDDQWLVDDFQVLGGMLPSNGKSSTSH